VTVLARLLAGMALTGMTLTTFAPAASAAMPGSACAGKGVCCASKVKQDDAQGNQDEQGDQPVSTECPPPLVPEVPITVLLPLSAAAVGGIVVVSARRRTRRSST
jgi:hypothetical protein